MEPDKTAEQSKAELIAWKEREAAERMELLRRGESGGLVWPTCRETTDFDKASLLYEIELEADRR